MAFVEPPDDIGLDDGKTFPGSILQILLYFLVIESLEQQPGCIAQVEEGFVSLVDKVTTIRADLEFQVFDRMIGFLFRGFSQSRICREQQDEKDAARGDCTRQQKYQLLIHNRDSKR